MLELGFPEEEEEKKKKTKPSRSDFRGCDGSPDSVIFTNESNLSHFSSASGSADRRSFASDVQNHEALISELSKHLSGHDLHECSSGPDVDPNRSAVKRNNRYFRNEEKAKAHKKEEEEEETNNNNKPTLDPAKNPFSQALEECHNQWQRSEALPAAKKIGRRRPVSLDLNNQGSNATGSSPRFQGMKKNYVSSHKLGTFPSPGTPNYWHSGVGWSSERVPLPTNGGRRMLPFNNGRTLPSKWEDAEKWIFSPASGDGLRRSSMPPPYRRPKSKSGPLGSPGTAYYSTYSLAKPMFVGGSVGNFIAGSPFSAGVLAVDCLPNEDHCSDGGSGGDNVRSHPVHMEPCIVCSASICGLSLDELNHSSLPDDSQVEKLDSGKDAATMISCNVSRRDMATQMSPEGSPHSSPKERASFSSSPPPSHLPMAEQQICQSPKSEIRDVQVDDQVTLTRWSKKHRALVSQKRFAHTKDWKGEAGEDRSSAWDVAETEKCSAKFKREEAKITAWETLQKAKAEAAVRKLEVKLDKRRSSSMEKIMKKLSAAQRKAKEMRSSVSASQDHQAARTSNKNISIRKPSQMSSLSGCFTCHVY